MTNNSLLSTALCMLLTLSPGAMKAGDNTKKQPISWVDTSMKNGEKFMLMVDGKPFYPASVQVRLDKLKASCGFDASARENAVKTCADYNFNTIGIPLHWREVEPEKNKFDWTILDEYLSLCTKYGIKMEVLWFSWSSGGRVQYLNSSQLRTPDYICSKSGTSEYKVLRNKDPWTLDWYDDALMQRETIVVDSIINHIAKWDAANGNPHTVIGMQMGNEPQGYEQDVSAGRIISYYSNIADVIKKSDYSIWTRINCVSGRTTSHVSANEELRNSENGTNIDFVGIDIYGTSSSKILGDCGGQFKKVGKNYMMIMESGAEIAEASHYMWAALRGGKAYSHYDLAGTDKHGMFDISGKQLVKHGSYVDDIANNNKVINLVNQDIARFAQGKSMHVYNYNGQGNGAEKGLDGIIYTPYAYYSHGVAIRHSDTEYVLATSARATFTIPESIEVGRVSLGHFDSNNQWVAEENISLSAIRTITVKEPRAIMIKLKSKEWTIDGSQKIFQPGKDWKDTAGKNINAHGGCVVKDGDYFYWIGDKRSKNNCVGVSCYRSKDLLNWTDMGFALELKGTGRDDYQDFAAGRALYRPKIAYNEKTKKWILCVVWENDNVGEVGMVAFATADKPYGPYELYEVKYTYNGRTRDQSIFKDDDGKLYYQACINGNADMWNCLMTDDYLGMTETNAIILPKAKYEAPALFKVDDTYFGLFSGCTGWTANRSRFAYSQDLMSTWKYRKMFTDKTGSGIEFCVDDSLKNTYQSQSAYVYKVNGENDKLIYIGDRWNSSNLESSKLIWLPISMRSGYPTVRWYDSWDMSIFDEMYRFKRCADINDGDEVQILEINSNRFVSKRSSGFCIDNDNEEINMRFCLHKTSTPYIYKVEDVTTGKYLEAVFSSLRLNPEADKASQQWLFRLQEDGTYIIENAESGTCLTISGCTTRAGSNIYLSQKDASQMQSFGIYFDSKKYPQRKAAEIFTIAYTKEIAEKVEKQNSTLSINNASTNNNTIKTTIYDISGKKTNATEVSTLSKGVYIVEQITPTGKRLVRKIVVK